MKIKVQHENGRTETINLTTPLKITNGKELSAITCDGTSYYFTSKGFYDGWSGSAPSGLNLQEVGQIISGLKKTLKD